MNTTISLGRYGPEPVIADCKTEICGIPFAMKFDLSRPSQRYIYECITKLGAYERETVEALKRHLNPGDTFFDVGAHVGYFTKLALELVGEHGTCVAFEPNGDNFLFLSQNCPKAHTRECVVGDKLEEVTFYCNRDNDGGHALWRPGAHPWNELSARCEFANTVSQITLDAWVGDKTPKVVKIDTEGAEVRVLKGASKVLADKNLTLVICELNQFGLAQLGDTATELLTIMESNGFKLTNKPDANSVSNLIFERLLEIK